MLAWVLNLDFAGGVARVCGDTFIDVTKDSTGSSDITNATPGFTDITEDSTNSTDIPCNNNF